MADVVIEPHIKEIYQNSLDFHLRLEIAGADLIIEDMDILQKRINDTNEALKSLGLDDDEILRFRTNFDPT